MKKLIAILAIAAAAASACGPPAGLPPYTDLASTIPWGSTDTNHAMIVKIKGENWDYPAGTVLRVTVQDAQFIANHGGYDLILANA